MGKKGKVRVGKGEAERREDKVKKDKVFRMQTSYKIRSQLNKNGSAKRIQKYHKKVRELKC